MTSPDDLPDAIRRAVTGALWGHPLLEDAIQEGRIEAWRRVEAGDGLGAALRAAIWRAQDVANGKQAFGAPERTPGSGSRKPRFASWETHSLYAADSTHDPLADAESSLTVSNVLEVLDPMERTIVVMMMDDYRHAEIAEHLDRSVGAVRKRMTNIRHKLAPFVEDLRAA